MRLFLAFDLPAELRGQLGSLQRELALQHAHWRWTRPDAIHLTVRFLGEVAEEHDRAARDAWHAAAATSPPLALRVGEVGTFPASGLPRVLWAGIDEVTAPGRLLALASRVEQAARDAGFLAESRPFRPHLTLARASRTGRPSRPQAVRVAAGEAIEVRELVLFRSQLGPAGARYTPLAAFSLSGR